MTPACCFVFFCSQCCISLITTRINQYSMCGAQIKQKPMPLAPSAKGWSPFRTTCQGVLCLYKLQAQWPTKHIKVWKRCLSIGHCSILLLREAVASWLLVVMAHSREWVCSLSHHGSQLLLRKLPKRCLILMLVPYVGDSPGVG